MLVRANRSVQRFVTHLHDLDCEEVNSQVQLRPHLVWASSTSRVRIATTCFVESVLLYSNRHPRTSNTQQKSSALFRFLLSTCPLSPSLQFYLKNPAAQLSIDDAALQCPSYHPTSRRIPHRQHRRSRYEDVVLFARLWHAYHSCGSGW